MTSDNAWLRFECGTEAELETFLARAPGTRPVRVILEGQTWGPSACAIVPVVRPDLDLRVVFMRGAAIGDEGVAALAPSAALATVHTLALERCGLTDLGVRLLAQSPHLSHLRELYLGNRQGIETGPLNEIGDDSGLAVARSRTLGRLETLDFAYTRVGDAGLEALIASPYLSRLSSVNAWGTRLTREGSRRVAALAEERRQRARENAEPMVHFWMFTDYDERIITY
jgi:hypothetical protein